MKGDIKNFLALSIVLPTYNERENVGIFIPRLAETFKDVPHEIIVVDDNSPDGTAEVVRSLQKQFFNLRLLVRSGKLGVGSALRYGYNAAEGNIILSSDADLAFQPADLLKLYRAVAGGYDLAIGSRHSSASGRDIPTLVGRFRYAVSRLGNRFLRLVFGIPLDDFSMNCRAIRRDLWSSLHSRENSNFFFFEMAFLTKAKGAKIIGVPVTFTDRKFGASKINLLVEIPKAFLKMIVFLFRYRTRGGAGDE